MVVDAAASSRWRRHGRILRVIAVIAVGLCVVLVLHPSLGYAPPGSVIAGADLRWDLLQILGSLLLVIATTATLAVALLPSATPRALFQVMPYALGAVVAYGVHPIIASYY